MMKQVFDKYHELREIGDNAAALDFLSNVLHGETDLSPTDVAQLNQMQGHCYSDLGDVNTAYACYRKAVLSNAFDDHADFCNTYMHIGSIEFELKDYHMSLETYKQALSHSCAVCQSCVRDYPCIAFDITDLERLITFRNYKSAERDADQKRICHHCHHVDIGTAFILCGCQHIRYCNDSCKLADADAHAATGLHMVLEHLPTGIFRDRILPLCILPADPNPATWLSTTGPQRMAKMRQTGLGLRTLGKWWKINVDQCRFFWLDVVPYNWSPTDKPFREVFKKYMMHELHADILQLACTRANRRLQEKKAELAREVATLGKAADKLRRAFEDKETKKTTAEKELEGVESRLKRIKK